ncbi:MAG TPA: hypothetical protein VKQ06_05605 [Gammaproteobacteria bacterium]|nr:hypothetical protein [Gammaproteobacteria bacterium]
MKPNDDISEDLPSAVIERLAAGDRQVSILTPQVDRAVIQAARVQFAARRPKRALSAAPLWGLSAAAAAALAFVFIAVRTPLLLERAPLDTPAPAALQRAAVASDYDGSGTLDVLDAFVLTRELARNPRFAANETVDDLMQRIVALEAGVQ